MATALNGLLRLNREHVRPASEMLTRAFFNDAETVYFLPDAGKRARQLPYLFRSAVAHGIYHGEAYATSPDLEGVAIWIPSDMLDIPFWRLLMYGGLTALFKVSPRTLWGMKSTDNYISDLHRRLAPFPHWYLSVLGVVPEHQGKGYASRLVRPMLARLDGENMPAYLETQNEKNVGIYRRYGFEVIETLVTPIAKKETWIMVRKK
jgi:ribosomal protein S18 acetylase RimI-like enzyme